MLQQVVELGLEGRVGLGRAIFALQVEDQRHQRFGDIAAAELAEMAALVGQRSQGIGEGGCSSHDRFSSVDAWGRSLRIGLEAISAIVP